MILNKDDPGQSNYNHGNYNHVLVIKDFSKFKRGDVIWANLTSTMTYFNSIAIVAGGCYMPPSFDCENYIKPLNNTYWRCLTFDYTVKFLKLKTDSYDFGSNPLYELVKYSNDRREIIGSKSHGYGPGLLRDIFAQCNWAEKYIGVNL